MPVIGPPSRLIIVRWWPWYPRFSIPIPFKLSYSIQITPISVPTKKKLCTNSSNLQLFSQLFHLQFCNTTRNEQQGNGKNIRKQKDRIYFDSMAPKIWTATRAKKKISLCLVLKKFQPSLWTASTSSTVQFKKGCVAVPCLVVVKC